MSKHISGPTSTMAHIVYGQFNKKYYESLEAVQVMYNLAFVLKQVLNGSKQAEIISENIFNEVSKIWQEINNLNALCAPFDRYGFKKKYD